MVRARTGVGRAIAFLTVEVIGFGLCTNAHAQQLDPDEEISIQDRKRPDWDAVPIQFGAFDVTPYAQSKLAYDDNIYATDANKVADGVVTISGDVRATSTWARHYLSLNGSIDATRGLTKTANDVTPYDASASGRLDIGSQSRLSLVGDYGRAYEPRGSFADTMTDGRRLAYQKLETQAEISRNAGRFKIDAGATLDSFHYLQRKDDGAEISEAFRNYRVWRTDARLSYAVASGISTYAEASYNWAIYPHQIDQIVRDSQGWAIVGGLDFGVTRLVRGRIGAGLEHQTYKDSAYPNISGLTFSGQLQWSPSRLVTWTAAANRTIERSPVVNVAGIQQSAYSLRADYELRRNVIVAGTSGYTIDKFVAGDRAQKDFQLGAEIKWLANRRLHFTMNTDYQRTRNTGVSQREFTRVQASISLRYTL